MTINKADMTELKRISTNAYDGDKACINRIIKGITDMDNEIRALKLERDELKKRVAAATPPNLRK